jgi:hypothetical protein
MSIDAVNGSAVAGVTYARTDEDVPSLSLIEPVKIPLRCIGEQPEFIVRELRTTAAFDSANYLWVPQVVICIPDPLGIKN